MIPIPSSSSPAVHWVRCQPLGPWLVVTHECPAVRYGRTCRHVREAVEEYRRRHGAVGKIVIRPVRPVMAGVT